MTPTLGIFGDSKRVEAILSFLKQRENAKPLWLAQLPFSATTERGSAFLLYAAALRGLLSDSQIGPFLLALWQEYGLQVFRLSHRPYDELFAFVSGGNWGNTGTPNRIPGVLRSVTDFFFREGSLASFLQRCETGEQAIRTLAESIFWMGKSSEYRNKPRYLFWLAVKSEALPDRIRETSMPPVSQGHFRLVFELADPAGKKRIQKMTPAQKLVFFSELGRDLGLRSVWDAYLPLEEFLERRGPNQYSCQLSRNGCIHCSLRTYCPIGKRARN